MIRVLKNVLEAICGGSFIFVLLILPFLRSRYRQWGSTTNDIHMELPGDELIEDVKGWYNHSITIDAPAINVWPWIVQLGQNKGGFYSYELLENMVGCKIHNADRIIPEFQDTEVGDKVMMSPKAAPYIVAAIDQDRAFVLRLRVDLQTQKTVNTEDPLPEKYQDSSWLFFLEETDEGTTRLITRSRNDWNQSKANTFFYGMFGAISIAMDRKMLKGIKKLAEATLS